jgi:hypothetical protein
MPFSASDAALAASSVYLELPPSTTRSPSLSRSLRAAMVERVASPAGIITQTTFGLGSASTSSSRLPTSRTSGSREKPTTVWPALRIRVRMLPPILPRPMSPMCIVLSYPRRRRGINR